LPLSIGLIFTDVSVSLVSGSGSISGRAAEVEDFLEQINPVLGPDPSNLIPYGYEVFGCSVDTPACLSCPPDFFSFVSAPAGLQSTLGLEILCKDTMAPKSWFLQTGDWRIVKPAGFVSSFPCGLILHTIVMDWTSTPGEVDLCFPQDPLTWDLSLDVQSRDNTDFSLASYAGTAKVTATFTYTNPLP
jgi:hypothetical protein